MMDLRAALHEASPTHDVGDPDIAALQRRADRGRRIQRVAGIVAVVAVLGVVGTAATALFGAGQPAQVDILQQPSSAQSPVAEPTGTPSTPVPADERDDYEAWRDLRTEQLGTMRQAATGAQRVALDDDLITEAEWLTAARAWQSCVRDGGYDGFELRLMGQFPGAAPSWSYENSGTREYIEEREDVINDCRRQHFASVDALWQDQETDYPTVWNALQGDPSELPSGVGELTTERLDDR